ncbi:MAG: hypothetical protein WC939_04020 [Acholeplasmataceae bacterium]
MNNRRFTVAYESSSSIFGYEHRHLLSPFIIVVHHRRSFHHSSSFVFIIFR